MIYDVIRTSIINAYRTYGSSDTKTFNKCMSEFYTNGKQNPSVAHMILVDQLRKEGVKQSQVNKQHLKTIKENSKVDTELLVPFSDETKIIERQLSRDTARFEMNLEILKFLQAKKTQMTDLLADDVKKLKENFDAEYKLAYLKSYRVRKQIIEGTNFSMDKVVPKRSYYTKIKLAEPEKGWESIYPKSYENRCRLISMDRIGKKGKVNRLKKIFWNTLVVKQHDLVKCFLKMG